MIFEVWKDIKGYENLYQVSNLGRVKSLGRHRIRKGSCKVPSSTIVWNYKPRILKPIYMSGHMKVNLHGLGDTQQQFLISHLVANQFLMPEDSNTNIVKVEYKDSDIHNCAVDNLVVYYSKCIGRG